MNPLIQSKKSIALCLIVLVLVLACFAISPMAQAVVPAPDGGYPGQQHGGRARRRCKVGQPGSKIPRSVFRPSIPTLRVITTARKDFARYL